MPGDLALSQVIGEQPAMAGIMVRSQIIKANGEPVNVDYMMRRNGDSWLISDMITLSLSRRLAGYFIGNGVAIANHASRRRCWAASHSRITLRCCSRSGDFAASRSRMDAWEASCIAAVSAGDTSIAKAALALKR
jgi:hypothetical protein